MLKRKPSYKHSAIRISTTTVPETVTGAIASDQLTKTMSAPITLPTTLSTGGIVNMTVSTSDISTTELHSELRQLSLDVKRMQRAAVRVAMIDTVGTVRAVLLHLRRHTLFGAGDDVWLNTFIKGLGEVGDEVEEMMEHEPLTGHKLSL